MLVLFRVKAVRRCDLHYMQGTKWCKNITFSYVGIAHDRASVSRVYSTVRRHVSKMGSRLVHFAGVIHASLGCDQKSNPIQVTVIGKESWVCNHFRLMLYTLSREGSPSATHKSRIAAAPCATPNSYSPCAIFPYTPSPYFMKSSILLFSSIPQWRQRISSIPMP